MYSTRADDASTLTETMIDQNQSVTIERERNGRCGQCNIQTYTVQDSGHLTPLTIDGVVFHGRCLLCNPINNIPTNTAIAVNNITNSAVRSVSGNSYGTTPSVTSETGVVQNIITKERRHVAWDDASSQSTAISDDRSVGTGTAMSMGLSEISCAIEEIVMFLNARQVEDNECAMLLKMSSREIDIAGEGGINLIIKAMKAYPWKKALLEKACGVLHSYSFKKSNTDIIVSVGGIETVIRTMEHHKDSKIIQQLSCDILCNLAETEIHQDAIVMAGGIRETIDAMQNHITDAEVQESACNALLTLASSADEEDVNVIISAVIDSMVSHPKEEGVLEQGCGVLEYYSEQDDRAAYIIAEGGAEEIIKAMMIKGVQPANMCGAIRNLTMKGLDVETFCNVGGVMALKQAMERYVNDGEVQELTFEILWNLLFQQKSDDADTTGFTPCINTVVSSMERHKTKLYILEKGCAILSQLANSDDALITIASSRGVPILIDAMDAHKDNQTLQEGACFALKRLSTTAGALISMSSAGGIETIIQAMKNFEESLVIQKAACDILYNVSLAKGRSMMNSLSKGITHVIIAMDNLAENASVIESASAVLYKMSQVDKFRPKIVDLGGLESCVKAIGYNPSNPSIVDKCCKILDSYSDDFDNRETILAFGGYSALISALDSHASNPPLHKHIYTMLSNMCANFEECHADYYDPDFGGHVAEQESRLICCLAKTMGEYPDDVQIQEMGCMMMRKTCAHVTECQSPFCRTTDFEIYSRFGKAFERAIRAVSESMRKYYSASIQTNSLYLLKSISQVKSPRNNMSIDRSMYDVVIDSLSVKIKNDEIKDNALVILEHMFFDGKGDTFEFEKLNVIKTVRELLTNDNSSLTTINRASDFLIRLSEDQNNVDLLAKKETVIALVKTLNIHVDNAEVQEKMISILHRISGDEEKINMIADAGGANALMDAIKLHIGDARRNNVMKNIKPMQRRNSMTECRAVSCREIRKTPLAKTKSKKLFRSTKSFDVADDTSVTSTHSTGSIMSQISGKLSALHPTKGAASIDDLEEPVCHDYYHNSMLDDALCLLCRLTYRKGDEYIMKMRCSSVLPFLEQLKTSKYRFRSPCAKKNVIALWKIVHTCL